MCLYRERRNCSSKLELSFLTGVYIVFSIGYYQSWMPTTDGSTQKVINVDRAFNFDPRRVHVLLNLAGNQIWRWRHWLGTFRVSLTWWKRPGSQLDAFRRPTQVASHQRLPCRSTQRLTRPWNIWRTARLGSDAQTQWSGLLSFWGVKLPQWPMTVILRSRQFYVFHVQCCSVKPQVTHRSWIVAWMFLLTTSRQSGTWMFWRAQPRAGQQDFEVKAAHRHPV